jgi:hypothetical protein
MESIEKELIKRKNMISILPFWLGVTLLFFRFLRLPWPLHGKSQLVVLFLMGCILCFGSIPYLYKQSYREFKEDNNSWKLKIIWIFIYFIFGMFFQIFGGIWAALSLPISFLVVGWIHINQRRKYRLEFPDKKSSYYNSLVGLGFYYLFLLCAGIYVVAVTIANLRM